jgi:hypothetical protein
MNPSRLQSAFDALDAAMPVVAPTLVRAKIRGLMRGYEARWGAVELQVLGVEELVDRCEGDSQGGLRHAGTR